MEALMKIREISLSTIVFFAIRMNNSLSLSLSYNTATANRVSKP
jgi:hypothetical protein